MIAREKFLKVSSLLRNDMVIVSYEGSELSFENNRI